MKRFLIVLPLSIAITGCSVSPTTVQTVTQAVTETFKSPGDNTAENRAAATYVASLRKTSQPSDAASLKKALATAKQNRDLGLWAKAHTAAENAVKIAPQNAASWLELAELWGDQAGALRRGRWAGAISSSQWAQLNKFYARWEACATQATKVGPQNGAAWFELSVAATFNSNH